MVSTTSLQYFDNSSLHDRSGFGGLDKLEIREDVPVPMVGPSEVLVEVGACGLNNMDINIRADWYNPLVRSGTSKRGWKTPFSSREWRVFR